MFLVITYLDLQYFSILIVDIVKFNCKQVQLCTCHVCLKCFAEALERALCPIYSICILYEVLYAHL